MRMKEKLQSWTKPFPRLSGGAALAWGALIMFVSTWLAWKGGFVFDTLFSVHYRLVPFKYALVFQLSDWAILALILYLAARIFSPAGSKVRVVDILGAAALSRAPFLLIGLFVAFPAVKKNMTGLETFLLTKDFSVLNYPLLVILIIFSLIAIVWFVVLVYNGFNTFGAVGKPKRLPVFVGSLVLAELLAVALLFGVFNPGVRQVVSEMTQEYASEMREALDIQDLQPEDPLYPLSEKATGLFCGGEYEALRLMFDDNMKESLSEGAIQSVVTRLTASIGKLKGPEKPYTKYRQDEHYEIVFVPLVFEKEKLVLQLAFNTDGMISGLYIKKSEK